MRQHPLSIKYWKSIAINDYTIKLMKKFEHPTDNSIFKKNLCINTWAKWALITVFIALVHLPETGFAQTGGLTLNYQDSSLENVLREIERKTSYEFIYSPDDFNLGRKITLQSNDESIESILDKIFKGTDVTYVILDDQIVLKKNGEGTSVGPRKALQRNIKGSIKDEAGLPLSGVAIIVTGEERGTFSDFDGNFEIQAKEGDILLFKYLGFGDVEIVVTEEDTYEVTLKESSFQLQGVELVSNGYQQISKERVTGSFEKVDEKILGAKVAQDVLSKIEGEVAGLLFDGSGFRNGGNETRITIRGSNTFQGDQAPLIVVDGFPLEGEPTRGPDEPDFGFINTSTVNPNDIESISVLRDAAAASIWGIRAANGVIVITTKKGRKNQKLTTRASFNTSITNEVDYTSSPFPGSRDQIDVIREILEVTGNDRFGVANLPDGTFREGNLRELNPAVEVLLLQRRGDISAVEAASRLEALESRDFRREVRLLTRPQIFNQYNFGISGGGENYSFNTSLLYNTNANTVIGDDATQIVINTGGIFNFSDKLKVRSNINYTRSKANIGFAGADAATLINQESLLSRIVDDNGNRVPMQGLAGVQALAPASQVGSDLALAQGFPYPLTFNTLDEIDNNNNVNRSNNIRLQAALDYNISEDLTATASYQYEMNQARNQQVFNENTFVVRSLVTQFAQLDETTGRPTDFAIPLGGFLDVNTQESRSFTGRLQLNYDKTFKDGLHSLTALAGYEIRRTVLESNTVNRVFGFDERTLLGIPVDLTTTFPLAIDDNGGSELIPNRSPNGSGLLFEENRFLSYYANAAYTFNNTYTLTGSIRLDDTNLFGASDEFRNIPLFSVGARWNLLQDFFYDSGVVNGLNLSASFGRTGNVARGSTPFLVGNIAQEMNLFNNRSAVIASPPNPFLRLERTSSFNLGLDFDFFTSNRVSGSVEYYRNESTDLLANLAVNSTLGMNNNTQNVGALTNEGVNAVLSVVAIDTEDFKYTTTGNFSFNVNTVTKSDVNPNDVNNLLGGGILEGFDRNTIFSLNYAGLDFEGAPQYVAADNTITDFTDRPLQAEDLIDSGTTVPRFFGSWINEFSYKNLTLRTLTTFRADYVFRADPESGLIFDPGTVVQSPTLNAGRGAAQRWRRPGDENLTRVPRIPTLEEVFEDRFNLFPFADDHIARADHIRLNQVILSYAFPEKFLKNTGLQSLNIGLQADNVAVWNFNRFDVDPEAFIERPLTLSLQISTSF